MSPCSWSPWSRASSRSRPSPTASTSQRPWCSWSPASPRRTCPGCRRCTSTRRWCCSGLLPPLLYSVAIQTSLVDFNANRRPILLLSVGLVLFTTAGVGVLVHAMLPGLGWPAAIAIGAVVAPPDAVAATAVGRRIGLPRRIVTILEGESLLNDATALVALRTAIAAAGCRGHRRRGRRRLRAGRGRRRPDRIGVLRRRGLAAQAGHRPADGRRHLLRGAVRGVHRSREGARLGRDRGGGRRPAARPQVADPPGRPVADRRAHQLAHDRVHPRERRLPADRAPGRVAPRRRGEEQPLRGPDRGGLRADAGGGDRDPDDLGLPGPLPPGAPGSRPADRQVTAVDLHVPARLGRHARRGHAGGGVRDPGGHRAPRGAAADRVHGGGRHAADPGPEPAVDRSAVEGAVPRPDGRRAGPGDAAAAGVEGRPPARSRSWSTTTTTASST